VCNLSSRRKLRLIFRSARLPLLLSSSPPLLPCSQLSSPAFPSLLLCLSSSTSSPLFPAFYRAGVSCHVVLLLVCSCLRVAACVLRWSYCLCLCYCRVWCGLANGAVGVEQAVLRGGAAVCGGSRCRRLGLLLVGSVCLARMWHIWKFGGETCRLSLPSPVIPCIPCIPLHTSMHTPYLFKRLSVPNMPCTLILRDSYLTCTVKSRHASYSHVPLTVPAFPSAPPPTSLPTYAHGARARERQQARCREQRERMGRNGS